MGLNTVQLNVKNINSKLSIPKYQSFDHNLLCNTKEQAQKMSETLSSKDSELSALQSKVKGLQHVVQGADGKIALLQFQLQKTKNVLKNQNQIASSSSRYVHA